MPIPILRTAAQISDKFVSDKVDLICAIATPSAQAAYNSAANTEIPVVYTAVTRSGRKPSLQVRIKHRWEM